MKKLKIFLLLSILLCFGFTLSSEVHAQGDGPKPFEAGDVLPATTHLKISWDNTFDFTDYDPESYINKYGQFFTIVVGYDEYYDEYHFEIYMPTYTVTIVTESNWRMPYSEYGGGRLSYVVIDISQLPEEERIIDPDSDTITGLYWEDLEPYEPYEPYEPKIFEEGDTLPAGYIKISWDFTGKPIIEEYETFFVSSGDDYFNDFIIRINFNGSSNKTIEIFNGGSVEHFNADTPGFTIITLTEPVTITDLKDSAGPPSHDYNVYVGDALTWEVVSQDYLNGFMEAREIYGFRYMGGPWMSGEAAWNHGYDKGSEQAWDEGYEYGMEIFGYYDPITEQWLSVEEYINLYGTDKMNQTDFYNNFDKYFIPAMIIVFGGVIVLTILKVFKGRE